MRPRMMLEKVENTYITNARIARNGADISAGALVSYCTSDNYIN
jgi:hypothetical protein